MKNSFKMNMFKASFINSVTERAPSFSNNKILEYSYKVQPLKVLFIIEDL